MPGPYSIPSRSRRASVQIVCQRARTSPTPQPPPPCAREGEPAPAVSTTPLPDERDSDVTISPSPAHGGGGWGAVGIQGPHGRLGGDSSDASLVSRTNASSRLSRSCRIPV